MSVARPIEVRALPGYRIWLRYDDGRSGEVDLSDLVSKGVFAAWRDRAFFDGVHLGPMGEIAWGDTIDLCPDAIYLRLTAKTPEEIFPSLKSIPIDA